MTAARRQGRVRVWVNDGTSFRYPEQVGARRPATGVCFSGGSTRSFAATIGQLRGLTALGLMPHVGYLSAVSGGAWAAAPYTFYTGPGETDADILGPRREPDAIDDAALGRLDPASLGYAATLDFRGTLNTLEADPAVRPDQVWTRAVGQTFLGPYGLFDPTRPAGFTLDAATRHEIEARNPALRGEAMQTVRAGTPRPYLLVHATVNWPVTGTVTSARVGFEYTPLYVGSPALTTLRASDESKRIGGGLLDPFAFGCRAPADSPDDDGCVDVTLPDDPFTLADAIGASSAFRAPDRDLRLYPRRNCWPVTGRPGEPTAAEVFTDGGDIENYGLIALLRRRVSAIVVFINTVWPLSLALHPTPTDWPDDADPTRRQVDPFLAPLFGQPSRRFPHNRVFSEADFPILVAGLQAAKRAGRTVMTTLTHTVQDNEWWDVAGGWDVRVCWVYNERVPTWEARLAPAVSRAIDAGHQTPPSGPVAHFPHYWTRGQTPGSLIRLTPVQVNLLAHLACWTVTSNASVFRELLGA